MSSEDSRKPFPALTSSLGKHKTKSNVFDMGDTWSGVDDPGKTSLFFNCLDRIDKTWLPRQLDVWVKDELILGFRVLYTNGKQIREGECSGDPSKTIYIADGDSYAVIQMVLESVVPPNSDARVRSVRFTFNTCLSQELPALGRPVIIGTLY